MWAVRLIISTAIVLQLVGCVESLSEERRAFKALPLVSLLVAPDRYVKENIRTIGVLNCFDGDAYCLLFLGKDDSASLNFLNAVVIDFKNAPQSIQQLKSDNKEKYVLVEGIFDFERSYKITSVESLISSDQWDNR
ncbi:MAG: hypothetical protein ACWA5K_06960 [bacterium]